MSYVPCGKFSEIHAEREGETLKVSVSYDASDFNDWLYMYILSKYCMSTTEEPFDEGQGNAQD